MRPEALPIPEALITEALKVSRKRSKRSLFIYALQKVINDHKASSALPSPAHARFAAARAKLQAEAQRLHPNGMTQAQINSVIQKARADRARLESRA